MANFFYYGCLSSAQLDRWQAPTQRPIIDQLPGRTDGIPERDQRPCDNVYKSVFTISLLAHQRNKSWIKGLGKPQQKE